MTNGTSTPAVWDSLSGHPASTLMSIDDFAPFVDGLDHPEGVAAGPDGEIYAGGEAGQIYRVQFDGAFDQIGTTGGFTLGLCLDADRNVYSCDSGHRAVMRTTPTGEVTTYATGTADRKIITPNYPVFDADGNLYISDSGTAKHDTGGLFRIRPGGETELITETPWRFPNGLALHPEGTHLYVVLSEFPGVVRVALKADGGIGEPETVVKLPHNVPDGLAFDEDRNLYVSCYTPDVIYRVTPAGEVAVLASDWESVTFATPTNIAFCGPERRTLVVASLSRWHLTKGEMSVAGARLNYPKIS
ncbi:MAG TPA: SMP-30/gluconolactonase/LRE family protein [Thermomicrobiales bacterium]|nr:SMP-30/gluconolactonase/LRE family protein [Thermomicrobiales bacterium]